MEFNNKVVIVTGGAQGIGKTIAEEFQKQGALICSIDKQPGVYFTGDLAQQDTLEKFAQKVITEYGHVDYLINNALPLMKGIDNCSYEEFNYALKVGVTAPFYLAKLFQPYFSEGAAIVNISSSRDRMSAGRVRVNSISPGWIDTDFTEYTGADAVQQPVHRVGNPMDIANMVLFLCSEKAGFITGENICIDGGMTKQMIYHGDCGWRFDI